MSDPIHPDDVREAFHVLCMYAPGDSLEHYRKLERAFSRAVITLNALTELRAEREKWADRKAKADDGDKWTGRH